jgi:hypothetical protein
MAMRRRTTNVLFSSLADWKTAQARDEFLNTEVYALLQRAWRLVTDTLPTTNIWHMMPSTVTRELSFNTIGNDVSVFFTWTFPDDFESSHEFAAWEKLSDEFTRAWFSILIRVQRWCAGRGQGGVKYCVVYPCLSMDAVEKLLAKSHVKAMYERLNQGCLESNIECMQTRCYETGWHGSVEQTTEYNYPSKLFGKPPLGCSATIHPFRNPDQ